MRVFTGTVESGTVRLPRTAHVEDGTRVLVAILPRTRKRKTLSAYPPELEAQDARFVQACRGRLANQLRAAVSGS